MWGGIAFAATYNLTISDAHVGNIILTAGEPGSPSLVTDASGTFNGAVSNLKRNTQSANGCFHETVFQTH